jgi:hypothetical protein
LLAEGRCQSPVPTQIPAQDGTFHIKAGTLPRGTGYVAITTATFVKLTGAAAERVERLHAARVERIVELDASERPSLPVARPTNGRFRRAEVTISWPLANTGPSIPNILAAVAGNLFECREVTGLRLLDLDLPASLLGPYQGSFASKESPSIRGILMSLSTMSRSRFWSSMVSASTPSWAKRKLTVPSRICRLNFCKIKPSRSGSHRPPGFLRSCDLPEPCFDLVAKSGKINRLRQQGLGASFERLAHRHRR